MAKLSAVAGSRSKRSGTEGGKSTSGKGADGRTAIQSVADAMKHSASLSTGGGGRLHSQQRDEAASANRAAGAFSSVIATLTEASATDWPKLFPFGINHIELELNAPSFKIIVKGPEGSSETPVSEEMEDTVPDEEPDRTINRALPPVTSYLEDSLAVYGTHARDRRYGVARTIEAINDVARQYHSAFGIRLGIGDISKIGGGPISGHASHRKGVDVDVRVPRRDTAEQASNYKDPSYSRERTQRLVELFRQNGFPVTHIFFNDPKVTGVSPWPNHDNHLHVRFDINAADDATS